MEKITSRDNPRIKHIRKLLSDRAYRYERGEYVIEGFRALSGAGQVKHLYLREGSEDPGAGSIPATTVSASAFEAISDTSHSQGIIAVAELRTFAAADIRPDARYILCDHLQDPGNMGSVLRSACAFGARGIIISPGCVDPFSPKVVRSSAGTLAHMEIIEIESVETLKEMTVIAADNSGTDVRQFRWPPHFILALGNEGSGLSPEVRALARDTVSIPIRENVESLNAGVAAGILMYCADAGR